MHNKTLPFDRNHILMLLIKDDLIYSRLSTVLEDMQLKPENYIPSLRDTIFWMAGFKQEQITKELKTWYQRSINQANTYHTNVEIRLEKLAEEIGKELKNIAGNTNHRV